MVCVDMEIELSGVSMQINQTTAEEERFWKKQKKVINRWVKSEDVA
jgi:hypothetical protein